MTNIYVKDGQEPPKQIHYNLGRFEVWKFDGYVEEFMESAYRKKLVRKARVMFTDGHDNSLLDMYAKKEGHVFLKEDHWVVVHGSIIMKVIWKPSGKVKFARYTSRDETSYKYLKKTYPSGTWLSNKPPAWIRQR